MPHSGTPAPLPPRRPLRPDTAPNVVADVAIPAEDLEVGVFVPAARFNRLAVMDFQRSGRVAPLAPVAARLEYGPPQPRRFGTNRSYPKIIPLYSHAGGSRSAPPTANIHAATTSSRAVLFEPFTNRRLPASSCTM